MERPAICCCWKANDGIGIALTVKPCRGPIGKNKPWPLADLQVATVYSTTT